MSLDAYRQEREKQTRLILEISQSNTILTKSILELIFTFKGVYHGVCYNRIWETQLKGLYHAISISSFVNCKDKETKENTVDIILQHIGIQIKGK